MLDMYHSIVDTKHTEFLNRVRSNMIPLAVVGDNNNSVKASKILILRKVPTLRYRTPKWTTFYQHMLQALEANRPEDIHKPQKIAWCNT